MPDSEVALALLELRKTLDVGFARIDGQLALLVQRSDQTDKALEELEERITALERNRWPLSAVAILASVAAVVLGAVRLVSG